MTVIIGIFIITTYKNLKAFLQKIDKLKCKLYYFTLFLNNCNY